jgi:hypothetical protein
MMAENLWTHVISPVVLQPLAAAGAAAAPAAGSSSSSSGSERRGASGSSPAAAPHARSSSWGATQTAVSAALGPSSRGLMEGSSPRAAAAAGAAAQAIRPVTALFVLERLFQLMTYQPLLHQTLLALLAADCSSTSSSSSMAGQPRASSDSQACCLSALMAALQCEHPYPAVMALRLLAAMLSNRHASAWLLAALDLLPRKRLQQQEQQQAAGASHQRLAHSMQQLMRQGTSGSSSGQQAAADDRICSWLLRHYAGDQLQELLTSAEADSSASDGAAAGSLDEEVTGSLAYAGLRVSFVSALMQLLQAPLLPSAGMWLVAFLLHQLLPVQPQPQPDGSPGSTSSPSHLQPSQQEQLQAALAAARSSFAAQLAGMWCEALFPLLANEWAASREQVRPWAHSAWQLLHCLPG